MKTFFHLVLSLFVFLLNGCASAPTPIPPTLTLLPTHTPVPTATPAPTATLTPAPILGIDEPIIVNDINVQVLAAEWEEPQLATGFQLNEGYRSLMITIKLQSDTTNNAADLMNGIEFRQMRVLDDQGNESAVTVFNLPLSILTGSEYAQLDLFFVVLEDTTPQAVRFVDEQTIELAPLLPK